MRLEKRRLEELKEYENNPRIIDKAVPLVAESIKQVGYITPIVIDEDGVILAGHTRLAALRENGVEECEVIVAEGLTEEQRKKYRILDNKTAELATWDNVKLKAELDGLDFEGFDFGQREIDTEVFDDVAGGGTERTVICPRCKAVIQA